MKFFAVVYHPDGYPMFLCGEPNIPEAFKNVRDARRAIRTNHAAKLWGGDVVRCLTKDDGTILDAQVLPPVMW